MPTQTRGKPTTLQDRIQQIDSVQARRFKKLTGNHRDIAIEGILRYLRACVAMDVNPTADAIRETIDGAIHGDNLAKKVNDDEAFLVALK